MTNFNFLSKFEDWLGELSSRMSLVGLSYDASGARVARERLKDKLDKLVNCAKSVMQIFATYATSASANFVGKESNESTVMYWVKSMIPSCWFRYASVITLICFLGIGEIWGETETSTFTSKNLAVGDGEPAWTGSTGSNSDNSEFGVSGRGVQYSAANGTTKTFTSTAFRNKTIKSVSAVVSRNKSGYDVSISVTVNGSTLGSGDTSGNQPNNETITTSDDTGIPCSTGDVVVTLTTGGPSSSAKSMYVKSISVTYSDGCASTLSTPIVTATPTSGQVVLTWPDVANATKYQLKWNGGSWTDAVSGVTKTSLTNGTEYTYQVKAIGNGSTICDSDPTESTKVIPGTYYTVTWMLNGSTYETTSVRSGTKPTFPDNPSSCDLTSTTFMGWTQTGWSGKIDDISKKTTDATKIYAKASDMPDVSGAVTYYAVFAKRSGTPLTNHEWVYTFTTNKYGSSGSAKEITRTLDGTESAVTVNKDWTLEAYGPLNEDTWEYYDVYMQSKDDTKGIKIGTNDVPAATMTLTSSSFSGTITAVKISTSGNSSVSATVSATVNGNSYTSGGNSSLSITSSNAEYAFTGNQTISGQEIVFSWLQSSSKALYIKKIEVDYTTGGDISYSNYMTSCATCVTPSGLAASDVTESGATITWSGTSASGTEGFKVAWNTANSVPSPLTGSNSADVAKNVKTYDITGLNDGTTYYVFVQSKCNSEWSSSTNFTTLAIHDITFTKDNGTLSVASPVGVVDGQTLTFPNVTSTSCGTFVGWKVTEVSDYDNVAAPSPLYKYNDTKENITADESYQAVYRTATGAETDVTDNVTIGVTGVTGNYADFTGATAYSSAVYTGNVKKDDTRIQMRNSSNSGIVTTTSGGLAKKVTFNWAGSNTSGRIVDVYGKNTAYSSAADLYSADAAVQGTKIGSITYGTSTELTISTDYNYIGIRAKDGAAYASSIDIQWYGSPMHYMTSPTCNPMVGITESLSSFTYAYGAGPSASQSFTVSGSNLTNNVTVAAPANYEVCLTAAGTYSSSVSIAQVAGEIDNTTVYIRLKEGLNVGSYSGGVVTVSSTGASDATSAALTGSVTKAAATMAFTPDVYEATYEGSPVIVNFMLTLNGDGTVAYSRSPATGSRPVNTDGENTFTALQAGIWTITATHTPGDNYTKAANATATVRVKCVDTYVDFIHNKAVLTYGSGTPVTDGKMEDWGSGYTVPYVADESEATSGSCQTTHFKFVGWVSEDEINIVEGTFKPGYTLISAGTAGKTASTKTYYAVWAKLED